jgi:hypothetical protein
VSGEDDIMASDRIGDMTMDELKAVIQQEIYVRHLEDERIKRLLTPPKDNRSVKEILESIDRHRFTPPAGSPSTLELLREDRDR